ncbi:MAG: NUDIX hydrolase [Eubacteriaceae bacterium]|nr:NUDIX hydrolase [Eubacteriaceae bacterium]
MDLYEKTLTSKTLYNGRILNLRQETIQLPDGSQALREIVDHKNGVGVLPIQGDCIVFVKQFRIAIHSELLEIPAGLMEDGENPEETATRELQEEIGLKPLNLKYYGRIWPTPGCCNELTHLFIASRFEELPLEQDDDEFIQLVKIPVRTVKALYLNGYFTDAKTACILGYYFSQC